jgi:hypothetical protein
VEKCVCFLTYLGISISNKILNKMITDFLVITVDIGYNYMPSTQKLPTIVNRLLIKS